jgi:hypothetical protein
VAAFRDVRLGIRYSVMMSHSRNIIFSEQKKKALMYIFAQTFASS